MLAPRLHPGDTIGIPSPSWLATRELYAPIIAAIEGMGYRVKPANNLYANGWGYIGSDRERADDINQLVRDRDVKLIFFTGGESAEDVLPLVDFDAVRDNPKLWLSYSDGTTLLNAVWAKTGLTTYYGLSPSEMPTISQYDLAQFTSHIVEGEVKKHVPASEWRTLCSGTATGTLTGGFLDNFIFLQNNGWLPAREGERYLFFIEDNECFWDFEHESALLGRLELSPLMKQACGLLFGHYSKTVNENLMARLTRLGQKWGIPVCYCDDFGHGENHGILPIGVNATLDAAERTLIYHGV